MSMLQAGLLPLMFPDIELNSKEPFTLTSFALSLLLVSGPPDCQPLHLLQLSTWSRPFLSHSGSMMLLMHLLDR